MTKEEAAQILKAVDKASYVDMIALLGMEGGAVCHGGEDGIIVSLGEGMHSVASLDGKWEHMLSHIDSGWPLVCVHDQGLRDHFVEKLGYSNEEGCWSWSWWSQPPAVPAGDYRTLDLSYMDAVMDSYNLADEDDVRTHLEKGDITGLFVDGSLAGYIGFHSEGSMGMLHIFEEHRRHGHGEALELYDIARALGRGMIPYCHVFFSNKASTALQAKLGLIRGEKPVWWLWKD